MAGRTGQDRKRMSCLSRMARERDGRIATNLLAHHRKKWRPEYFIEGTESIVRLPGGITQRKDLFGFVDTVLVPVLNGPWIFCQVTSRSNISTRLRKIQQGMTGKGKWATPMRNIARSILASGHRILVEGWDQPKGPGTAWRSKERELTLEDLA